MNNSSTERKQNHWPAFKSSTGQDVHCRSEDVPGMRLCSGVWPCILGMSYTSVLLPVPKCGGIGGEGFLCILFKNKVGEILSMFFFHI